MVGIYVFTTFYIRETIRSFALVFSWKTYKISSAQKRKTSREKSRVKDFCLIDRVTVCGVFVGLQDSFLNIIFL